MKTSFPTLDQLKEVVRAEGKIIIAAFDRDLKLLEGRMGNVEDKLGSLETKVGSLETKVGGLETKVDNLKTEMNQRFDENADTHQLIVGMIDEISEQKVSQHSKTFHQAPQI